MIDEYSMLRDEIMLSMKTVKNYNSILYTSTVALLAFAFNLSDGIPFFTAFHRHNPTVFLDKTRNDSSD